MGLGPGQAVEAAGMGTRTRAVTHLLSPPPAPLRHRCVRRFRRLSSTRTTRNVAGATRGIGRFVRSGAEEHRKDARRFESVSHAEQIILCRQPGAGIGDALVTYASMAYVIHIAFVCFILAARPCSETQLLMSTQKGAWRSSRVAAMEAQALRRNRIKVWGVGSKRGFLRVQVRA